MKQLTTTKLVSLLLAMVLLVAGCSAPGEVSVPTESLPAAIGDPTASLSDGILSNAHRDFGLSIPVRHRAHPCDQIKVAAEPKEEELIYDPLLQQEIDTFDFEMPLDTYDEFLGFLLATYPLLQNAGYVPRNYTPTSVDVYSDGVFIVNYDVCDNYYMKDGGICAVFYLGDGSLLSMQTWTGEKLRGKTP